MRLHIPVPVRWSDLDAYGHVNNATMLTLLEEARILALWDDPNPSSFGDNAGVGESTQSAPFSGGASAETYTLIARQEVEYLLPIPHLRDPLDVELWIGRIGGASVDVCYEIFSPVGAEPRLMYARATTVMVLVDVASSRPRRLTDDERTYLSDFVDAPLEHRR